MPKREKGVPAAAVHVDEMIVTVRGERVILDHHLARLYGVTTKALNQAVRRNPGRFPGDFVYHLTFQEVAALRSQTVTSNIAPGRSPSVTRSRGGRRYQSQQDFENSLLPGCSKRSRCKAARDARCEAYLVRTSQRRASAPTPQMNLFQQPAERSPSMVR